jgi:hypothetical protein
MKTNVNARLHTAKTGANAVRVYYSIVQREVYLVVFLPVRLKKLEIEM